MPDDTPTSNVAEWTRAADLSAYDQALSDAQRQIGDQTAQFLKSLSLFLPFLRTHRPDRD